MRYSKKHYPAALFWHGLLLDLLRGSFFILLAIALVMAGRRWDLWFAVGGVGLFIVILVVCVIRQFVFRYRYLHHRHVELAPWQDSIIDRDCQKRAAMRAENERRSRGQNPPRS